MKQNTKNTLISYLQTLKYIGYEYMDDIKLDTYDKDLSVQTSLPNNLEELNSIVSNCNLCNFSQNNNIVFSQGDESSNIVFINTYSFELDIQSGKVFTGATEQLLAKICKNVLDISIEDTCILNILKCTPTKDISECKNEINMCKSYIHKQLDIIQPKLIIAFGKSCNYLLDENKEINELRDLPLDYKGIKVVTTFHPIDVLRNPSYKKDVFNDFKKIKQMLEL